MHRKFSFRNEIQRKSIFTGPIEDATDNEGGDSLNLALQNIREVPRKHIAKAIVGSVRTLDLSYNNFEELGSLQPFENLETLVLDHNDINSNTTFPNLPNLRMLSLNSNKISNLSLFVRNLAMNLPGLKYLSLMKNEAAPSYFNGGTVDQFQDYRNFIISHFAKLEVLDDRKVTEAEKTVAYSTYGRRWKVRKGRVR